MGNDDVTIDGDQRDREQRDGQQTIAQQRKQSTEQITVCPGTLLERRRGQWQIEAAEEEIRAREIYDEYGRRVASLFAPRQGHDGQQVAGHADNDEHNARDPGKGEQLIRVALEQLILLVRAHTYAPIGASPSGQCHRQRHWRHKQSNLGLCRALQLSQHDLHPGGLHHTTPQQKANPETEGGGGGGAEWNWVLCGGWGACSLKECGVGNYDALVPVPILY